MPSANGKLSPYAHAQQSAIYASGACDGLAVASLTANNSGRARRGSSAGVWPSISIGRSSPWRGRDFLFGRVVLPRFFIHFSRLSHKENAFSIAD